MLFSPVFAKLQCRLDPQVAPISTTLVSLAVAQPLCFQTLAHSCSTTGNVHLLSFLSLPHSFHRDGGCCAPLLSLWNSIHVARRSPLHSSSFFSYCSALFSTPGNSSLFVSCTCALFGQK